MKICIICKKQFKQNSNIQKTCGEKCKKIKEEKEKITD